ncbi:MAG: S8 family serine peptidase [Lachnospiraceae bacterium]|nr:S8 family serine peptidase [Lachnospiraceae bacterium]
MGKKGISKKLIALLLVSVMLLSGISVRYVTQETDNRVDSIAVSNDFTDDNSGPVELVKNVTDVAPTQLSSAADDGSNTTVNNVNNIVTDNVNGISEEFARTSSFTPGVGVKKTGSADNPMTESEEQTEADNRVQVEADNGTASNIDSNIAVEADNSAESVNRDVPAEADSTESNTNSNTQAEADNSAESVNRDVPAEADSRVQIEADNQVTDNTKNSIPVESAGSTQTEIDSAAPVENKEIQTDANVNMDILLADASVKNSISKETEEKKEAANNRLALDPEEETMSEILAETMPQKEDVVDFMVVLDKEPLLAVFSSDEIRANGDKVAAYRSEQEQMIDEVKAALKAAFGSEDGFSLGYDRTLSTTSISVRTKYSNQAAIEQMEGVKTVYISPTFGMATVMEDMDIGVYTNNAPGMIGATELNQTGYTGKGMKIAIIDTGIVVDHPSFQALPANKLTSNSMTEAFVDEVWDSLNAGESTSLRNAAYHNSKLPFIFNYWGRNFDVSHQTANHDHGTHVAGIVAANQTTTPNVVGIAPDAQVIVMQVFNPSGGAEWSTIIAALEDCVLLDVDAVNLSLGSPAGFTDDDLEMKAILDRFENTDTHVIIAGGNDTNNAYMNLTGTDMSKTKNIDNGLIGTPATASGALAVASADNDGADLPYFTVGNRKIGFSDSAVTAQTNFLERFKEQTLEFVFLDGIGDVGDYANKEVKDKVVVVSRGTTSFQEKQKLAKEKGAIALVVYNNIPGSFSMAISDGDEHIPCVAISRTDGEYLRTQSQNNTTSMVVCKAGDLTHTSVERAMSSFSSWGVTPDLKLKPEITGVGGNIYASRDPLIGGSNYGTMSGTSMASPQVAGAITILTQYLKETYPNKYQDKELRTLATNLLMSTASQIKESETVYSPRYQGAGLVDLTKATTAGAYLSSTTAYENRPKGEMGDDDTKTGVFTFGFTITNITNTQKTYTFDSTVLTPDVDETGEFMTNTTRALESKVVVKKDNQQISQILVPASSSVELSAEITLTGNDKNFINNNFENGTYVEGYLYVNENKQDGVNLSMPFLGFFGNWSSAPVFDDEGEEASLYAPTIKTRKGNRLGHNPYITGGKGGDQYNAISNANPLNEMVFGMMRNSKKVTQTVTAKDNKDTVYFTLDEENIIKTYYSATYGMIIPYILFNYSEEVYIWDGTNNGSPLPDNTTATYTLSSYLDDGDEIVDDTYAFDVTIDNISPVVENADNLSEEIDKDTATGVVKLPLSIRENHYVAAVIFESMEGDTLGKFEVSNTPGETLQTEFDVTGYGTDFTVIVADYACNETEVDVSLDLSDMPTTQAEPKVLDKNRIYGNETYSDGYVSMGWFSANKENFEDLKNETFDMANRTYSGEYINGYVIAKRSSDGALMLLTPYNTYWNTKVIWTQEGKNVGTEGFIVLYDMAMNYADQKLYGIGWLYGGDKDGSSKDDGYNALFEICLEDTITVKECAKIQGLGEGIDALTLGCTTEGKFYTISTQGILYELSKEGTVTEKGTTDFVNVPNYSGVNVIQSMCYDHEGKEMYWYAHSQTYHAGNYINVGAMYKVDLDDATLTKVGGSGSSGYTSLFIPTEQKAENIRFRQEATDIEITPVEVKMAKGQTRRVSVEWKPWNALPGTVEWSSANQDIATVNNNGVIKAVDAGETEIIAKVKLKDQREITREVKVTVVDSADGLYGFLIRDYNGKIADSSWVTYSDSNLKNVTKIGSGGMIQGGAYYEGYIYFVVAEQIPFAPTNTMFYKSSITEGETPDKTVIGSPELIKKIENIEIGNIAFDYTTGRMYGVDYTNGGLCLLDVETGSIDRLGTFQGDLNAAIMPAMCVTANGNVIGSDMFGNLYHINPDDMKTKKIGSIEPDSWFYAGMTYDHNTGNIYWNPCMDEGESDLYLVKIDEKNLNENTTEIINLGGVSGDKGAEQTVIFTIPSNEPDTVYTQAESIEITNGNGEDLIGLIGGSLQLTTKTEPLRPSTYAREWSSDNEEVVSIDQFGKVTFKKEGTATITVKVRNKGENPDPDRTDTVKITVYPAAGEMAAFLASDEGATSYFDFWITIKDYAPQQSKVGTSMIGTYSLRTGEYYDGYFYAYNDMDVLYRINEKNPEDYVTLGNGGLKQENRVISMAFDYTTGTMYGVTLYKDMGGEKGKLVKINLSSGAVTEVVALDKNISAIAIDGDGRLYGVGSEVMYGTTYLYEINKETGTATQMQEIPNTIQGSGGVDWTGDNYMSERMYSSQMTYEYDTNRLYLNATIRHKTLASHGYGLYMIQLKDEGENTAVDFIAHLGKPALDLEGNLKVGDMYLGMLCAIPDEDDIVFDKVTGLRMNRESARVTVGENTPLSVIVSPSGVIDKTVTWSTGDATIATVDENGVVTGVKAGKTTIIATSNSNKEITAICNLTVLERSAEQKVSTAYTISAKQEALISFDPDLPATTAKELQRLVAVEILLVWISKMIRIFII